MDVFSLLNRKTVLPNLEANSKSEVLDALVSSLKNKILDEEAEAIREAVMEREKIMSTGVGKGLAIPHGKTTSISETHAAFATLKKPVDYDAIDGEPVNIIFLLAGPQSSNSLHIKMLSRISRLMNNGDFRNQLLQCTSAEEIIGQFKKEEHVALNG